MEALSDLDRILQKTKSTKTLTDCVHVSNCMTSYHHQDYKSINLTFLLYNLTFPEVQVITCAKFYTILYSFTCCDLYKIVYMVDMLYLIGMVLTFGTKVLLTFKTLINFHCVKLFETSYEGIVQVILQISLFFSGRVIPTVCQERRSARCGLQYRQWLPFQKRHPGPDSSLCGETCVAGLL